MQKIIFLCLLLSIFLTRVQASDFTLSGTCKQADNTTNCSNTGTIRIAFNNTLQTYTQPIVSGTWSINALTLSAPASGTIITIFIEGALDNQKAVAVTQYDGTGDITGIELIETHLSIGSDDNLTINNAELALYDNSVSGNNDIFYDINASGDLTVDINNTIPNETLYIKTGTIFQPLGNLNTHHVYINGTLTANNNILTVVGDWEMTNGTFNRDTSTVNFTGTGTILNDVSNWWNKAFYKINLAAAGQTTTVPNNRGIVAIDVATLGTGTLEGRLVLNKGTTPLINNGASFVNASIKFSPPSNQSQFDIPAGNYPNLWLASNGSSTNTSFTPLGNITCATLGVYGNGLGKSSILETNGHNISCDNLQIGHSSTDRTGKLTVNSGSTLNIANDIIIHGTGSNELDATSSTINIGGNWSNSSLFTAGTSTVNFNGNSNQTLSAGGDPFYNVTIDNTGAVNSNIVTIDSDITLNNDLIINDGVLDTTTNNYNLTVLGNFDQSSTTGELEANASTLTIAENFNADGSIDRTNYNNATIELIGSGTLNYLNLPQYWSNGFKNLITGQFGNTTLLQGNAFAVGNVLTVGSGAFTGAGTSLFLGGDNPLSFDPNANLSINSLQFFGGNQTIPTLTNGYDTHIHVSRHNTIVTQIGSITLNAEKNLGVSNTFPDRMATYNTNGFSLDVDGNIFIGTNGSRGPDSALKTLDISGSNVTVGRDFEIRTGTGTLISTNTNKLISTNSTITLNSTTNTQAINMDGNVMDALILNNSSTAGVTFNDAFTANTVTNTIPNSTMTFATGQNFTVNSAITLQGASGQLINLISSSPGSNWNFILNAGATKNIDHVSVSWSDASGSHSTQTPINPNNTAQNNDTIAWFPEQSFSFTKNSTIISDPFNGTGGGKIVFRVPLLNTALPPVIQGVTHLTAVRS